MSHLMENQKFKAALWETAEMELAELPDREQLKFVYSKRFLRNMKRILRAEKYGYLQLINAKWKRTVAACVTVCILLSGAMSVKAIREPVVEFIEYCYKEFTRFVFGANDSPELDVPDTIETEYIPTYLPEGYVEDEYQSLPQLVMKTWVKEDAKLTYRQAVGTSGERIIDTETQMYQELYVDALQIYYLVDDTHGYYQWIDHNYLFSLDFTGTIEHEEVLKIIASVSEKNN